MSPLRLNDVLEPYKKELDEIKLDLEKVSDLRATYNGEDLAFVDLVIEGGGVKGVAVTGAIFALEYLGIRFRKIAGTSAGAINAAFLAIAGENLAERRAERLANVVFNMDLLRFVDGGRGATAFVNAIMTGDKTLLSRLHKFVSITRNIETIFKRFGLNPGRSILKWLSRSLAHFNHLQAFTVADLKKRLYVPNTDIEGELQVIATDITNRRKAVFPRDLNSYVQEPDSVHLADLVRASLSIPFFFEPHYLGSFKRTGGFQPKSDLITTEKTMFVDGALVSNFPLDIFDKPTVPKCPTIGILFDNDTKQEGREINSITDYLLGIFETMNEHGDRSYMFTPRSKSRIIKISNRVQGRSVRTMYFNLSRDEVAELFGNGIRAAIKFVESWDFQTYVRDIRSN